MNDDYEDKHCAWDWKFFLVELIAGIACLGLMYLMIVCFGAAQAWIEAGP